MQMRYTEEKLNTFSKETLIQLFLAQQEPEPLWEKDGTDSSATADGICRCERRAGNV